MLYSRHGVGRPLNPPRSCIHAGLTNASLEISTLSTIVMFLSLELASQCFDDPVPPIRSDTSIGFLQSCIGDLLSLGVVATQHGVARQDNRKRRGAGTFFLDGVALL